MSIESLNPYFAPSYENFPKGRTISLVLLRTTCSETIFRTEGTGEPMCTESMSAGKENRDIISRLVMTKRKQIAPERRRGREFLRNYDLLKGNPPCSLNTNAPCGLCIDCFLYGFAVGGGGGAQKSRIWTEDAFSLLSAVELVGDRTINALYETGTMRLKQENGDTKVSSSLNTSEYIKPGAHFLDIVTLRDVTADELRYILGNIRLTTRYGAVSSRVGRMENEILGIFGGITELPSCFELVQEVYDQLQKTGATFDHPFNPALLKEAVAEIITTWRQQVGIHKQLSPEELTAVIADVDYHWSLEQQESFLRRLDQSYDSWRQAPTQETTKKGRKKR